MRLVHLVPTMLLHPVIPRIAAFSGVAWLQRCPCRAAFSSRMSAGTAGGRRRRHVPRRAGVRRLSANNSPDLLTLKPQTLGNWGKGDPEQDCLLSSLSANGQVGVKIVSARHMLQSIRDKRQLGDAATELLGRALVCAMLVAHGIKDEETLQLTFQGDGLAKGVMAISDGAGKCRGWIGNANLEELKHPETGKVDIKAAVGRGTLQVVKSHPNWKFPYNGVVELASGEVAPDVAYYLSASEQRNTAIGSGVRVRDGQVQSAGGFYVEMLPGVEEESISQVEGNLAALQARKESLDPGELLASGMTANDLAASLLEGLGVGVAEQSQPAYQCTCSVDKVFRAIRLMGSKEIESILRQEGRIQATCEFCNEVYELGRQEVAELGMGVG